MSAELFQCDKCPKFFTARGRYNQHLKTHSKPFRCEPCQRGFALRLDLNRHIKTQHRLGSLLISCPYDSPNRPCSFETKRKDNLQRHVRKSHQDTCQTRNKGSLAKTKNEQIHPFKTVSTSLVDFTSSKQLYTCSMFMQAANTGNLTILKACLNAGVDLQSTASDGSTALHCAARAGRTEAAQYLLDEKANVHNKNKNRRTPLEEAILGRCVDTVKLFLTSGIPESCSLQNIESCIAQSGSLDIALMYADHLGDAFKARKDQNLLAAACEFGQHEMVARLLERPDIDLNKTDLQGNAPIHRAVRKRHIAVVHLLLASKSVDLNIRTSRASLTPLHIAALKGHVEIVESLLKKSTVKINLNVFPYGSPLQMATQSGHLEVVKLLLSRDDVDVNCQNTYPGPPLHVAASNGRSEIVKLLLGREDIEMNSSDYCGRAPLHEAILHKHLEVVELLLSQGGIDVNNAELIHRRTALHFVASSGHLDLVKLLLQHKRIDSRCETSDGELPLHLAAANGHWKVVRLILFHWTHFKLPKWDSDQAQELETVGTVEVLTELLSLLEFRDINSTKYNGRSLLHCSILNEDHNMTSFLLAQKEVDVNLMSLDGRTALHIAANHNYLKVAMLLLQHKSIDMDQRSLYSYQEGLNALQIAQKRNFKEMADLLLSYSKTGKNTNLQATPWEESSITGTLHLKDHVQANMEHHIPPYSMFDEYMDDIDMNEEMNESDNDNDSGSKFDDIFDIWEESASETTETLQEFFPA